MSLKRGALIILEGVDRSGKSTQCKKLVQTLHNQGEKIHLMRFPDRTTETGKLIDGYLSQKFELEDHAVHLLFSVNRWEAVPKITELVKSGTTVIIDRYAYSGVAFTAAKPVISRQSNNRTLSSPCQDRNLYQSFDLMSGCNKCQLHILRCVVGGTDHVTATDKPFDLRSSASCHSHR
ncbi:thymidylate kinase-like isoform X2 [Antedon mediterranea]|uniref:thymidylate kinase-like isoform X2 n=1 Tax=Antedon mediterranea TaxID=105859 RepID=UPI003AF90A4C